MKSQVSVGEIAERIREEARLQRGEAAPGAASLDADGDGSLPAPPPLPPPSPGAAFIEGFLAEVNNLIARARIKGAAPRGVPKFLRPLYRNQGGFNGVTLEALDTLREIGRELAGENERLRAHLTMQEAWMRGVARQVRATQARLDALEQPTPRAGEP